MLIGYSIAYHSNQGHFAKSFIHGVGECIERNEVITDRLNRQSFSDTVLTYLCAVGSNHLGGASDSEGADCTGPIECM